MIEVLNQIKTYLSIMLGQTPKVLIKPNVTHNRNFIALQAVNDSTVTTLTDSQIQGTGWQTGDVIDSGTVLFGDFTAVEISAGLMVGYLR